MSSPLPANNQGQPPVSNVPPCNWDALKEFTDNVRNPKFGESELTIDNQHQAILDWLRNLSPDCSLRRLQALVHNLKPFVLTRLIEIDESQIAAANDPSKKTEPLPSLTRQELTAVADTLAAIVALDPATTTNATIFNDLANAIGLSKLTDGSKLAIACFKRLALREFREAVQQELHLSTDTLLQQLQSLQVWAILTGLKTDHGDLTLVKTEDELRKQADFVAAKWIVDHYQSTLKPRTHSIYFPVAIIVNAKHISGEVLKLTLMITEQPDTPPYDDSKSSPVAWGLPDKSARCGLLPWSVLDMPADKTGIDQLLTLRNLSGSKLTYGHQMHAALGITDKTCVFYAAEPARDDTCLNATVVTGKSLTLAFVLAAWAAVNRKELYPIVATGVVDALRDWEIVAEVKGMTKKTKAIDEWVKRADFPYREIRYLFPQVSKEEDAAVIIKSRKLRPISVTDWNSLKSVPDLLTDGFDEFRDDQWTILDEASGFQSALTVKPVLDEHDPLLDEELRNDEFGKYLPRDCKPFVQLFESRRADGLNSWQQTARIIGGCAPISEFVSGENRGEFRFELEGDDFKSGDSSSKDDKPQTERVIALPVPFENETWPPSRFIARKLRDQLLETASPLQGDARKDILYWPVTLPLPLEAARLIGDTEVPSYESLPYRLSIAVEHGLKRLFQGSKSPVSRAVLQNLFAFGDRRKLLLVAFAGTSLKTNHEHVDSLWKHFAKLCVSGVADPKESGPLRDPAILVVASDLAHANKLARLWHESTRLPPQPQPTSAP